MKRKILWRMGIVNALLTVGMLIGLAFFLKELEGYVRILLHVGVILLGLGTVISLLLRWEKISKSLFTLQVFLAVVLAIFFVLNATGIFHELSDIEYLQRIFLRSGPWGVMICFFLIVLNVVLLPLPALVIYLAVAAVYGSLIGFLISYVGTVVGSLIAFAIGRKFGKRTVSWIVGEEDTEKYAELLKRKGKVPFLLMQLLPFFPDDILCMVAGLSNLSYRFITVSLIVVKPFYIAAVCFFGWGDIIPFYGWGIPVWIGIFACLTVFCIVYFRNQEKIDQWLFKKFGERKK